MIEIWPNLHVGSAIDYERQVKHSQGWSVIHACKEPYHRQALGYAGKGAPKDHPEYLIARREHRLILNLVDVENPAFIPKVCIDAAIDFANEALVSGRHVLIHCNQGASRAPSIGLLYLAARTNRLHSKVFADAEKEFLSIYPAYAPAVGIREFSRQNFAHYSAMSAASES